MYENNIPGYVVISQLRWLEAQAEQMDSVAEIGSWKGRSGHALATGCKGKVYLIDTFEGNKGEEEWFKDKDAYEQCVNNLKDFNNIEILKMRGDEAVKIVPDIDMIFIDGEHTYEAVKSDIEKWKGKVRKLICGHDIGRECVQRAVEETIGTYKTFEGIWYKTK